MYVLCAVRIRASSRREVVVSKVVAEDVDAVEDRQDMNRSLELSD